MQTESFELISKQVYNPAKIVNQQLLDVTPGALVAVTHIDDCIGILEENEISFPEEEFIHRLQQKFLPMQSNDGMGVYLQPRMQHSIDDSAVNNQGLYLPRRLQLMQLNCVLKMDYALPLMSRH